MTGLLLALCMAAGVALLWLGAVVRIQPRLHASGLSATTKRHALESACLRVQVLPKR